MKVGDGHAPPGHLTPSAEWFNPFHHLSFTSFMVGFTLMLFIYWGWDTAVSVNEETKDSRRTPGRAAVLSTLILLVTYALVVMAIAVLRGHRHPRHRPRQPQAQRDDVINGARDVRLRDVRHRVVHDEAAVLMVLSSAAASTQTTILPTARTTLSMATYKAIPAGVRADPQALPHADRVDRGDGRSSPSRSTWR